jgi:hypothetical protein
VAPLAPAPALMSNATLDAKLKRDVDELQRLAHRDVSRQKKGRELKRQEHEKKKNRTRFGNNHKEVSSTLPASSSLGIDIDELALAHEIHVSRDDHNQIVESAVGEETPTSSYSYSYEDENLAELNNIKRDRDNATRIYSKNMNDKREIERAVNRYVTQKENERFLLHLKERASSRRGYDINRKCITITSALSSELPIHRDCNKMIELNEEQIDKRKEAATLKLQSKPKPIPLSVFQAIQ